MRRTVMSLTIRKCRWCGTPYSFTEEQGEEYPYLKDGYCTLDCWNRGHPEVPDLAPDFTPVYTEEEEDRKNLPPISEEEAIQGVKDAIEEIQEREGIPIIEGKYSPTEGEVEESCQQDSKNVSEMGDESELSQDPPKTTD